LSFSNRHVNFCSGGGGVVVTQSFAVHWNRRGGAGLSSQHTAGLPRQHAKRNLGDLKKGDDRRRIMRNRLLVTTAMAALIGCTTLAVAQETNKENKEAPGKTTVAPQGGGAQHPTGPGGAMAHPQPGGAMKPGAAQNLQPKAVPEQQQQSQGQGTSQTEEHDNPALQRGAQSNEPNRGTGTQQPGPREQNAQGNPGAPQGGAAQNGTAPNKASGGASVQLSQEQRGKIQTIIGHNRDVARVDNVNFNITVGTTVPRTVHVAVLPVEVVTVVPEYRGFDYIIVGDQLLIIDPNTMEIVAVLPA
jgi:hypothetical protein